MDFNGRVSIRGGEDFTWVFFSLSRLVSALSHTLHSQHILHTIQPTMVTHSAALQLVSIGFLSRFCFAIYLYQNWSQTVYDVFGTQAHAEIYWKRYQSNDSSAEIDFLSNKRNLILEMCLIERRETIALTVRCRTFIFKFTPQAWDVHEDKKLDGNMTARDALSLSLSVYTSVVDVDPNMQNE